MMNPLQQLGDLKKMRDQAMALQRELEKEEVTVDKNGVEIVISGAQKVIRVTTNGQSDDRIRDAINEAIKKSQEVAAKKLQQMGGMGGLGGLFGK